MSKNNDKNNNHPLDDIGIKNDQIISCVEKIVDTIEMKLNIGHEKITAEELHAYSSTLFNSWALVKNMVEFIEDGFGEELNEAYGKELKNEDDDDDEDDDIEDDDEEDDDDNDNKGKNKRGK